MAWEIVLAQDRTIDWTTEELIAELERAYLELETVGPWANSETQHLAVLTYSSGLHMLEQTAVSSRSGVSVIDIPSKE